MEDSSRHSIKPWEFCNQDGKYLFKLAKCALALLSLEAATKGVPISGVQAASRDISRRWVRGWKMVNLLLKIFGKHCLTKNTRSELKSR